MPSYRTCIIFTLLEWSAAKEYQCCLFRDDLGAMHPDFRSCSWTIFPSIFDCCREDEGERRKYPGLDNDELLKKCVGNVMLDKLDEVGIRDRGVEMVTEKLNGCEGDVGCVRDVLAWFGRGANRADKHPRPWLLLGVATLDSLDDVAKAFVRVFEGNTDYMEPLCNTKALGYEPPAKPSDEHWFWPSPERTEGNPGKLLGDIFLQECMRVTNRFPTMRQFRDDHLEYQGLYEAFPEIGRETRRVCMHYERTSERSYREWGMRECGANCTKECAKGPGRWPSKHLFCQELMSRHITKDLCAKHSGKVAAGVDGGNVNDRVTGETVDAANIGTGDPQNAHYKVPVEVGNVSPANIGQGDPQNAHDKVPAEVGNASPANIGKGDPRNVHDTGNVFAKVPVKVEKVEDIKNHNSTRVEKHGPGKAKRARCIVRRLLRHLLAA